MSGPKVDVAELRRQEMMRLAAAREGRKKLSNKIEKLIKQVKGRMGSDLELMKQDENLLEICNSIVSIQEECCKDLEKLLKQAKDGNELLDVDEINQNADVLMKKFNEAIESQLSVVNKLTKSSEKYQQLEKNRQQLEQAKRKRIVILSSKEQTAPELVSENDIKELSDTFQEELTTFMQSRSMTSRHKNSMLLIHQDLTEILESVISYDKKEKRIKRLFEDYQKMVAKINSEMDDMEAIYEEYLKECFDLSAPTVAITEFSSKREIEELIKETREVAEAQLSKEYIKRQIDEVMQKHGYDVVKSDMLTEVNQSGRVLYGVDNDTAIDVFVSDENQVTMRIVGVGFDSNITEAEDEKLFQQQCAFCGMHPKITAELAMRGVILHTKKHMPPDKKFNKKIQTKTKNSSQSGNRAKKELKRTELKTMYKE